MINNNKKKEESFESSENDSIFIIKSMKWILILCLEFFVIIFVVEIYLQGY